MNQEYQNKPKTTEEFSTHRANWDQLVGVVHHGDEEVEQDDDVDDGEGAEHDEAPEPRELLDARQLKVVEVDEAKRGPKQGLTCFPETEIKNINVRKERDRKKEWEDTFFCIFNLWSEYRKGFSSDSIRVVIWTLPSDIIRE